MEKKFQGLAFKKDLMADNTGDPVKIMNAIFDDEWTYVIKDIHTNQDREYLITISVEMPGLIRDGFGKGNDSMQALKNAILMVIQTIEPTYVNPLIKTKVTEADKINKLATVLKESNETSVLPSKEAVVIPGKSVTMRKPEIEIEKEFIQPKSIAPIIPTTGGEGLTTPQPILPILNEAQQKYVDGLMKQHNIEIKDAINLMKIYGAYKIKTKDMLLKYMQGYDNNIKHITDLGPTNVGGFVNWMNNEGKSFNIEVVV